MRRVVLTVLVILGGQWGLAGRVVALSVGSLTVQSHYGEPFRAEVKFMLESQERGKTLDVKIGSAEDYKAEGLERHEAVAHLKTALATSSPDTIGIYSETPFEVADFHLLLLVRVGHLTIFRNYHVTLPQVPTPVPAVPVPVARTDTPAPAPPPRQVITPPQSAPVRTQVKPPRLPVSAPPVRLSTLPQRYGPIKNGATLYGIVRELPIDRQKLWQAVVVLWRANHAQFLRGNLHGLRRGGYLDIPADFVVQLDTVTLADSQRLVSSQWDAWKARQETTIEQAQAPLKDEPGTVETAPPVASEAVPPVLETEEVATQEVPEATSPTAVLLPTDSSSPLVSVAELQGLLQGLEERLAQRLTPTQEPKGAVGFVSTSELQTTLRRLEERLTQKVELMLGQGQTPIPADRPLARGVAERPMGAEFAPAQRATFPWLVYFFLFLNAVLLACVAVLTRLWWQGLSNEERQERLMAWRSRLATWRSRLAYRGSKSEG